MAKEESNKIKIVYRDPNELIPCEYNPRKISSKDRTEIKNSIRENGFVDPVIINQHPDRKNVVVGGNQRRDVAVEMGLKEIPTVEVNLPLEKEKKLVVRLNRNQGQFDLDLLREHYQRDDLLALGFNQDELWKAQQEFAERINNITNADADMPVVPKFNEKYQTVMIFCDSELDFNWLRNVLGLKKTKDYKTSRIGETLVISVKQFQEVWAKNQIS